MNEIKNDGYGRNEIRGKNEKYRRYISLEACKE